ncbi:MAG: PIN domain-containing protein [Pseudomonadota bacterium]
MPNAFLDTNIIIYAATTQNDGKSKIARDIVGEADFCLSVQVLHEFYINMRNPVFGMSEDTINVWTAHLLEFECAVIDTDIFFTAKRLCERHGIHYYDAAMVAAAKRLGAGTIFTEDLNNGQDFDGVRAINPFADM